MKRILAPLSLAFCTLYALTPHSYAQSAKVGEKVGDKVVMVSEADKDMNVAIQNARATLDDFLKLAANPPAGAAEFKLKVMFTDKNGSEHFWVTPFENKNGKFSGVVANDPHIVTSIVAGESYPFTKDQITDWGYKKNGKQIGSYTVCVMFKTMPKELVARYRKDYGFDCQNPQPAQK